MIKRNRVLIYKQDEVYLYVSAEPYMLRELSDHFTFDVPAAKFHPKYKMGAWDGKIRLLNYKDGTIYACLASHIKEFCKEREYALEYPKEDADENFSIHEAVEFIKSLNIPSKYSPLTPERSYQVDAFVSAVQ